MNNAEQLPFYVNALMVGLENPGLTELIASVVWKISVIAILRFSETKRYGFVELASQYRPLVKYGFYF